MAELLQFSYPDGCVIIGAANQMPLQLQRAALTAPSEIRKHLNLISLRDPVVMNQLRELVMRTTSRRFSRDDQLITYLTNVAASPTHPLLVVDLANHRFHYIQDASLTKKFEEVLRRTATHLPGSMAEEFKALLTPKSLAMIAGTLALWAGAHLIGVGEAIDVLLVAIGLFMIGRQIIDVAKYIISAISLTAKAKTEEELDAAAQQLARAIAIVGVTVFVALIAKVAAKGARRLTEHGAAPAKQAPAPEAAEPAPKAAPKPAPAPAATPKYQTKSIDPQYAGEETGSVWGTKVKYLSESERQAYKLTVKDGKLYDANGNLFDTSNASSVFGGGGGKAIFVMDEYGNIYASKSQVVGQFHHSSLLSGQPVAGAGEMSVSDGVITSLSRRSGHYRPGAEYMDQVLQELGSKGVNTSTINLGSGF